MALRFQTYFGIPVPPFKEEKMGAGTTTIRFVLPGKIISKKNNQQAFADRKEAREFIEGLKFNNKKIGYEEAMRAIHMVKGRIRGNDEYAALLKTFQPIIEQQKDVWKERLKHKKFDFPIRKASMTLRLYFKDKYVTDTVNKQQTIQDLLITCGVIANDDYKSLNPINSASACYYEELIHNIAFISLSFRL
jgi:hypothetical protein